MSATLLSGICVLSSLAQNADSLMYAAGDSAIMMREVSVSATRAHHVYDNVHGSMELSRGMLDTYGRFMGVADPVRLYRTLPAVSTGGDINGGMNVQGTDYSTNYYTVDKAEVINPMHMLGLFSVFNVSHFEGFSLIPGGHGALNPDFLGASFEARTSADSDTVFNGEASVGVMMASATLRVPVDRRRSSLILSARRSLLDVLFPSILSIDHATLKYNLVDANATWIQQIGSNAVMHINFMASADHMNMNDKFYDAKGSFGWKNLLASALYQSPSMNHILSWSRYTNRFVLRESTFTIALPSAVSHLAYRGEWHLKNLMVGWDTNLSTVDEQGHRENAEEDIMCRRTYGLTASVAGSYSLCFGPWSADAGLRLSVYTDFNGFTRAYPMPRFSLRYSTKRDWFVKAILGWRSQFSHLVKESGTGLPVDFRINASDRFRPATSRELLLSAGGPLMGPGLSLNVELYAKRFRNLVEFNGAVINMINSGYNPLEDLLQGHGYSAGVSVTLSRGIGRLRGWAGYTLGVSKGRFDDLGDKWFSTDNDRRHDFKAALSWNISRSVQVATSYVYATGNPYTAAAYGYMIGENLICEYQPHNSSRLPAYKRLDISLDLHLPAIRLHNNRQAVQSLNVSFYNLLFNKNVLYSYITYSTGSGLSTRYTGLKSFIPSVAYNIKF